MEEVNCNYFEDENSFFVKIFDQINLEFKKNYYRRFTHRQEKHYQRFTSFLIDDLRQQGKFIFQNYVCVKKNLYTLY